MLEAAEAALEAGDLQGAAEAFAAVLQEDQQNAQALAGLARCYLKSGDTARAEQTLALVPPDKRTIAAVQSAKAALELAKMAGKSDNRAELEAAPRRQSGRPSGRFDLAVALGRARAATREALDHLLEIVRTRPQMERGSGPQAARSAVRRLGSEGPADPRRPPAVCRPCCSRERACEA